MDASGMGVWSEGRMFQVEEDIRFVGIKENLRKSLKEYGMSDEDIERVLTNATSGLQEVEVQERSQIFSGYMGVDQGTEGTTNTYYGNLAGATATGSYNSFFGRSAGYQTTGNYNTFVGHFVGRYNQSGAYNTFMGRGAGKWNFIGSYNTYIGAYSGHNTTSSGNTMLGAYAGYNNSTGYYNTFLGYYTGRYNTTGERNTFIGYYAGFNNSTGNYNVFLGNNAGYNETGSSRLYIDNSTTSYPLIWGNFNTSQIRIYQDSGTWVEFCPGSSKDINIYDDGDLAYCSGTQWVDSSSREVKENIQSLDAEEAIKAFEKLEPVKFNYKRNKEEDSVGFIAEDVPDLVATKDRKGMVAMDVVAVLTKVVQEQQKGDDKLTQIVQEQQVTLKNQQKTIDELRKQIDDLKKRK